MLFSTKMRGLGPFIMFSGHHYLCLKKFNEGFEIGKAPPVACVRVFEAKPQGALVVFLLGRLDPIA